MKKKLLICFILLFCFVNVSAEEITGNCQITINNENYSQITDGKYTTYVNFTKDEVMDIKCDENITHVYIYYDKKSSSGLINDKVIVGKNNYLHELIKLDGKDNHLTINYHEDYAISEIHLFDTDVLPDWVEDWQT